MSAHFTNVIRMLCYALFWYCCYVFCSCFDCVPIASLSPWFL